MQCSVYHLSSFENLSVPLDSLVDSPRRLLPLYCDLWPRDDPLKSRELDLFVVRLVALSQPLTELTVYLHTLGLRKME